MWPRQLTRTIWSQPTTTFLKESVSRVPKV
ncbi:unnamed protein product [Gulo gulo]|uniref:Uncharacterized protein n=1 Tax=Gulo gulo TaxID=48420 RepID=A0A9X9LVG7_GULGU|nr:unnamed protein product [Gulo gulo]